MTFDSSDVSQPSVQVTQAEQALATLKLRVTSQANQQTRLKRFYREWQQNWLCQSEQLRRQMEELESRLAPWMPRDESPRLSVVGHTEEAA